MVDAATGAAPQGAVTVKIAAINPATNPANMPGDYTTSTGANIESFGALSVQLRDAAGKALNLASGQSATIRIPLASRSGLPPPTVPLFYFNETTGLWVEEGVATLAGVAPNQYYEGSVKHFSTWNADKALDSIFVNGCVSSADGKSLDAVPVISSGIDYSGIASTRTNPEGKFRVAMRRNSQATIGAAYTRVSNGVLAGPSTTDITLPECLKLLPPGTVVAPAFLLAPASISAPNGTPVYFRTTMTIAGNFSYQWSRNGRPIEGATLSTFLVPAVALTDDQAQFTVTVTNSAGSVTSSAAKLTVTPATPPAELASLIRLLFQSFGMSGMVAAPLNEFTKENEIDQTFWLNPANVCRTGSATGTFNGQPIPVGTLVATGSNRVSGTFNDCASINSRDTLSGTSNISYTLNAELTQFNLTGDISDFRLRSDIGTAEESSLTGNGSAQFTLTKTKANGLTNSLVTFAPSIGSTLRNNLTGQLTQFTGGDSALTDLENAAKKSIESSLEQRNLRFILDGVSYASNGKLSSKYAVDGTFSGSGQLSLMRNGFQVGRLFITPEGYFVDINGVVQRL
ncbi:hypothetical protein [Actimicrobium antarcticum]|uniref:hypothetical protein n=1 Tax=Actimicrobium antarcticum TaxID=1051899 RepID=UPI0031DECE72